MEVDERAKNALVTGSARRNGRDLALWLARHGVNVAVHYHNSHDDANATRDECEALGVRAITVQGDLTDHGTAATVVAETIKGLGGIDVLVNNVGNYLRKGLLDLTPEEWCDQIESSLYSAFYCIRNAWPHMKAQRFGRIVNMGYASGERPTFNYLTVPYHIAKTGVYTLTKSIAAECADHGVTINTIGVGIMENSIVKPDNPPGGRYAGAGDLGRALGFFLADGADHINGTQLDVSGGWTPEQILRVADGRNPR